VGEDVEVVDGPEADKGDPERGRKGREGHRARSPSPARRVRGPTAPNAGPVHDPCTLSPFCTARRCPIRQRGCSRLPTPGGSPRRTPLGRRARHDVLDATQRAVGSERSASIIVRSGASRNSMTPREGALPICFGAMKIRVPYIRRSSKLRGCWS
jgi:hypothetical protein